MDQTPITPVRTVPIKGTHPGFADLKSQPGVYRSKLWPATCKKNQHHADYAGYLLLTGSRARILVWVHEDGSLGLRLEKISPAKQPSTKNENNLEKSSAQRITHPR